MTTVANVDKTELELKVKEMYREVATNPHGESFWIYREHRDLSAWYLHGVFA